MDTKSASEWVTRFSAIVPAASPVLDLACGSGRHTWLFAAAGHPVTAVDRDISKLAKTARLLGVEIIQADLERPAGWPLPGCKFGGIVVASYLYRPLFPNILEALDESGVLIYETFALGNEKFGKPSNPDFLLKPGELLEMVHGQLHVVAYEHGQIDHPRPAIVQRICAVRATSDLDYTNGPQI